MGFTATASRSPRQRRLSRSVVVGIGVLLVCLLAGALSLIPSSAPTTDPWGWIIWGRQVAHLTIDTDIGGSPSWKPLPVFFTAVFSLGGDAAPGLWLMFARALSLLSLVIAFRVGWRLAVRAAGERAADQWLAGAVGGLAAAAVIPMSSGWVRGVAHGYAGAVLTALLLGALDRHLSGRRDQAFLLGTAASLLRPEAYPAVLVYALLAFPRAQRLRWLAVSLIVPILWVVPDWIGSNKFLHANHVAAGTRGYKHITPFEALWDGGLMAMGSVGLVLAGLGTALGVLRRDRMVMGLALATAAWMLLILLMMVFGYPHGPRFYEPPATFISALAGSGAGLLIGLTRISGLRIATATAVVAALLAWGIPKAPDMVSAARASSNRAKLQDELRSTARRLNPAWLRSAFPVVPHGLTWNKIAVAWELNMRPHDVYGVRTSANNYIRKLSAEGSAVPQLPANTTVVVKAGGKHALLLLGPFGRSRIQVASTVARWDVRRLMTSGRWTVVMLRPLR